MIKAVLFDIDNTLLDFDAYVQNAMKEGFEIFNLGSYDDSMFQVFRQINGEMWGKIELGLMTYEELLQERWNRIFSALNISFDGCKFETYFKDCLFESSIPIKGALNILDYLKESYILCVASNGPYEQQMNRLKKGKMISFFSHFFISEKIGFSKPSKEFFSHCLNALNDETIRQGACEILPSEIIMIGDSIPSDMSGAVDSGFKTCFFDKNMRNKTDGFSVDYVINNLEDIQLFL